MHKKIKVYLVLTFVLLAAVAVMRIIALAAHIELIGIENAPQIIGFIGSFLLGDITTLVAVALQLVALHGLLGLRTEGQGQQGVGLNGVTVLGMVATAFRAAFVLVSVILFVVAIAQVKMAPEPMLGNALAVSQRGFNVANSVFGVFIMALATQIVHEVSVLKYFWSHTQRQEPS